MESKNSEDKGKRPLTPQEKMKNYRDRVRMNPSKYKSAKETDKTRKQLEREKQKDVL